MAENEETGKQRLNADGILPARFLPGTTQSAHTVGASRDPAGARVRPTGWTALNVEATAQVLEAAGNPSDFEGMGVYLAADPKVKEIAGRLIPDAHQSLSPFKYDRKTRTAVIYLHGMFKDYPKLRIDSERWVSVNRRSEADVTFFVLQLNLALRRNRRPRGQATTDGTQASQALT